VVGSLDGEGLHRLRFEDEEDAARAAGLIEGMDGVDSEPNYAVPRPTAPQSLPTGAALPFSLNPSPVGENGRLTVGLIDTAVQRDGGRLEPFLLPEISLASGDVLIPDAAPTHGTSMAETVLRGLSIALDGENSSVRILPVDVYGNNETSSTFDVARGISEAIKGGANYINLSERRDLPGLGRESTGDDAGLSGSLRGGDRGDGRRSQRAVGRLREPRLLCGCDCARRQCGLLRGGELSCVRHVARLGLRDRNDHGCGRAEWRLRADRVGITAQGV
jgi:hypothetical protein